MSSQSSFSEHLSSADQPSLTEQPEHKTKRLHYTPELKLKLIHLCINNHERYLEEASEVLFWQYITALFDEITGYYAADLHKKVTKMVGEQKAVLKYARRSLEW